MVENTFGILGNRLRVFRNPIVASEPTAVNIVKAAVAFHNYLFTAELQVAPHLRQFIRPNLVDHEDNESVISGSWRELPAPMGKYISIR